VFDKKDRSKGDKTRTTVSDKVKRGYLITNRINFGAPGKLFNWAESKEVTIRGGGGGGGKKRRGERKHLRKKQLLSFYQEPT